MSKLEAITQIVVAAIDQGFLHNIGDVMKLIENLDTQFKNYGL